MTAVIWIVGLISIAFIVSSIANNQENARKIRSDLMQIENQKRLLREENYKNKEILSKIEEAIREREYQNDILSELTDNFNYGLEEFNTSYINGRKWLAQMFDELLKRWEEAQADLLLKKKRPAVKASEKMRKINKEKRELTVKLKFLEYQLKSYQEKFPFLVEFEEEILNEEISSLDDVENNDRFQDASSRYLSKDEYKKLAPSERNQLALNRYLSGSLNKAAISRLYERYIGWQYEQQGFRVEYYGAIKGFDDLGRDLICRKNNEIHVVQAKCWSEHKQIHENHICQLFGTATHFMQDNIGSDVKMILITSTELSEVARLMANALGVEYSENYKLDKSYPVIKCNINRKTGEKIYHLPFDQMYDKVIIEPDEGEMYAATVFEAEFNGFRRAFRYRG